MEDRLKFRGVEDLSRGSHLQNGLLKEDDLVSIMAQGGEIVGGEEDGEIIFLPDLVQHIQQQMLSPHIDPGQRLVQNENLRNGLQRQGQQHQMCIRDRIKAKAVMEATGLPAIADDSGLMVDALDGAPGVYSARYGGPGLDDTGRWQLLLRNMAGQSHRTCRFVSVICCAFPDGSEILALSLIHI